MADEPTKLVNEVRDSPPEIPDDPLSVDAVDLKQALLDRLPDVCFHKGTRVKINLPHRSMLDGFEGMVVGASARHAWVVLKNDAGGYDTDDAIYFPCEDLIALSDVNESEEDEDDLDLLKTLRYEQPLLDRGYNLSTDNLFRKVIEMPEGGAREFAGKLTIHVNDLVEPMKVFVVMWYSSAYTGSIVLYNELYNFAELIPKLDQLEEVVRANVHNRVADLVYALQRKLNIYTFDSRCRRLVGEGFEDQSPELNVDSGEEIKDLVGVSLEDFLRNRSWNVVDSVVSDSTRCSKSFKLPVLLRYDKLQVESLCVALDVPNSKGNFNAATFDFRFRSTAEKVENVNLVHFGSWVIQPYCYAAASRDEHGKWSGDKCDLGISVKDFVDRLEHFIETKDWTSQRELTSRTLADLANEIGGIVDDVNVKAIELHSQI